MPRPSIAQALKTATDTLAETSTSAHLDAEVLLRHALECSATHLLAWPEKTLDEKQLQHFEQLIVQRRSGVPVAYLTGHKEFWSLDFRVTPATLIPRPETELLVEFVLDKFSSRKKLKLIDLGTGSGAIAIALASEKPDWSITATDVSEEALAVATENARTHRLGNIRFVNSHWFDQIEAQDFDLIISNPPYIARHDVHLSQGDVRFEPPCALISGDTGMDAIEHITSQAKHHLSPDGWLVFEHGYDQKQALHDCLSRHHFQHIIQREDLSAQPRITAGR